jgi:hypothetical protein
MAKAILVGMKADDLGSSFLELTSLQQIYFHPNWLTTRL